jgi:membrane protein DedA with SNARE-associated domain/membrane-associated phospholipid phosphatase
VVTAAAFAAHGRLSLPIVFIVATVASSAGTTVAFLVGRGGMTIIERHGGRFRISMATVAWTRAFFERHGDSAVLFGRFLPVMRMLVSPVAGLSGMSARRFTLYNVVGAVIWSATFCALGYFFGRHLSAFYHGLGRATLVVVVGLAVLVTVVVAGGWLIEDSEAAWRAEGTIWHHLLMSPPIRWLAGHSPAARAFLFRRFTPGDYLGLNLTLGLGLSFIALVTFSAVENAVLSGEAVVQLDLGLSTVLREGSSPQGDALWTVIGWLGSIPVMSTLGLTVAAVLTVRHAWLPLVGWVSGLSGSVLLDLALKQAVGRVRPAFSAAYAVAPTGTFPSGHALGALVGYGLAAYFLVILARSRWLQIVIIGLAAVIVAALSFSRLYLATHYFSDIVGGLAAGSVWLAMCITGLEVARRKLGNPQTLPAPNGRRSEDHPAE